MYEKSYCRSLLSETERGGGMYDGSGTLKDFNEQMEFVHFFEMCFLLMYL